MSPKSISYRVGDFYQHYPRVAVAVTARAGEKATAMAAAWHSAISFDPPLYGVSISPRRYTCELILESQEFGVNFLPFSAAELLAALGGISGREIDKFQAFGLALEKPLRTSVPVLAEAYAAYECKTVQHYTCGDHEWFVGEIVAVHYQPEALTEKGALDLEKVRPALYLGSDLYGAPDPSSLCHLDRRLAVTRKKGQGKERP